ncbi:MAG: DNA internalization-related competence protein ComEC/Rec2 [Rhodocyclales bacterium]|nr:DNA internalization-related competence protein ComEC/Rec2 [Rhodocyclales bacterium]
MRTSIVAFALGVAALQCLAVLPALAWLRGGALLLAGAFLVVALAWRRVRPKPRRVATILLACVAGFMWAAWRAEWRLAEALPQAWEARDVEVTGVVTGLVQPLADGARFGFAVESSGAPVPALIQLAWYAGRRGDAAVPDLKPGQRWRLHVRLKRPHGLVNPNGFDYEAWLLERGIRATGYVRGSPRCDDGVPCDATNVLLAASVPGFMNTVHRWRDAVRTRFVETLASAPYAGVLVALAVGDQRAISQEQWSVFRRTGVAHLVSISGLHVALVALVLGWSAGWGWRRVPRLALYVPARHVAACVGLLGAAGYALLAGLGLPAQRALIMLAVAALALMARHEMAPSRSLALALLMVLVVDPWAVLAAGFWLSFGAVGVILLVVGGRLVPEAGWRAGARIQIAISFALIPLLVMLFNGFPVLSPLANALAIPLVSVAIAPLSLLAVLLPVAPLLQLAHGLTVPMMSMLEWLAGLPMAMWVRPSVPPALIALAGLGVLWLLLPRGTPGRFAALLACVPMLVWTPQRPPHGALRVTILDVGQGTAVHVQTAAHDLLYDAGPRYGLDADAGERVVLPYLAASGVARLDQLVLTHGDSDHTGGASSVLAGLPVGAILHGLPQDHAVLKASALPARPCVAGTAWAWDGVRFEMLHPASTEGTVKDNDRSCVLRIAGDGGSVLLAGDIEAAGERELLAREGAGVASDVVLVPHHGSRTSSSPAFVRAVGAAHAVYTVGYLNPFHHPHPQVWARWAEAGVRQWRTDARGAVLIEVGADGVRMEAQRARVARYWHGR